MSIKSWLKNDQISLGIILSLIIPLPVALFFASVIRLIQINFHVLGRMRMADILLLGFAANLIVMRYYLVKLKFEKTGKSMMVLTIILILLFFFFLKDSDFTLPF